MSSKPGRSSDSAWHLRGAITGTLYGFGDVDASTIAQFFMDPIYPVLSHGLTDFGQVVQTDLPGLRFLLITIDDSSGSRFLREIPDRVLDHFKFYKTYQVRKISKS